MLCGDDDGRAPKLIQEWIANELAYKPLSTHDLLHRGFLLGRHFANAVERPIESRTSTSCSTDCSNLTREATPPRNDPISAWVSRVLRVCRDVPYLVVPATRLTASLGVAGAAALAIYFDNERPYPTTCHPPEPDKWQHCYVGCKIASWCPVGSFSASILAILKEVRDVMNRGRFSWADVFATLAGAWDCATCGSCEACCCKEHG